MCSFLPPHHNCILPCPPTHLISQSFAHPANWPPAPAIIWHVGQRNVSSLKVQLAAMRGFCLLQSNPHGCPWWDGLQFLFFTLLKDGTSFFGQTPWADLWWKSLLLPPLYKWGEKRSAEIVTRSRSAEQLHEAQDSWTPVIRSSRLPDDAASKKMICSANPQVTLIAFTADPRRYRVCHSCQ